MAACGSLQHLFERSPLENPTLMESLSWGQRNAVTRAPDTAAFTELFGELHFEERRPIACPAPAPPPPLLLHRCSPSGGTAEENGGKGEDEKPSAAGGCRRSPLDSLLGAPGGQPRSSPKGNRVFSRSESLHMCTEGLGFESSNDLEYSGWGVGGRGRESATKRRLAKTLSEVRPRTRGEFPPPISSIGSGGKPLVCFRSHREGGRFVLREVKIPSQELLRASRQGGRLQLRFAQPEEEVVEEGGEKEEGAEGGGGGAEDEEGEGEEAGEEIGAN